MGTIESDEGTITPPRGSRPSNVGGLLLARAGDLRPGLVFEDRVWTWDDHVGESVARAEWLASMRVDGPFHIGVLLENVPDFPFLLGAAALSGAVVVGLNPTRRGTELAADVARTDCQLIVTDCKHLPLLDGLELPVGRDRIVDIDAAGYRDAIDAHRGTPIPITSDADPGDLMMLIFTSGTSGHRKITWPALWYVDSGLMTADDNVYVSMPMFHSACVMAAWAPCVATGATMSMRRRFSASGFLPDVRRLGVTYFHYVGKPLSYILATPQAPDDHDSPLRLANGNEASEADIARFAERFGCTVIDAFGSTEGGVAVTRTPDTPQGSLGPLPAHQAILDPDTGEPVATAVFDASGRLTNPEAAIGELVNTTGAGAFEGYYNDTDADGDRMRGGMYWSGDLAYRDADGFIYFAGRSIEWLRVDGENFTAAPIERVLSRHAPVALIAVYAVPSVDVGDEVMATIVVHDGNSFDPQRFISFLAEQGDLGTKWVPRFVRVTRELPQTSTNKVQKRVLASEAWLTEDHVWWLPDRRPPHHYELMAPDDKTSLASVVRGNGRGHLLHAITAPTNGQKVAPQ